MALPGSPISVIENVGPASPPRPGSCGSDLQVGEGAGEKVRCPAPSEMTCSREGRGACALVQGLGFALCHPCQVMSP